MSEYNAMAADMAKGVEAVVRLVVDPFVQIDFTIDAMKEFHSAFPATQARIQIEGFHAAVQALSDDHADLGLMPDHFSTTDDFERRACGTIELAAVAAPGHPLSLIAGPIESDRLRDNLQLVTSTRTSQSLPDHGIHAMNRWHLTDLDCKHRMLLAGLGWGSMPRARIANDLQAGRLVQLRPDRWDGLDQMPIFSSIVARKRNKVMGRAGRWLVDRRQSKLEAYFRSGRRAARTNSGPGRPAPAPAALRPQRPWLPDMRGAAFRPP